MPLALPFGKYNLAAAENILNHLPKKINAPMCDWAGDNDEYGCPHQKHCNFLFERYFSEDKYYYYCTYVCAKDEGIYALFGVDEDAVKAVNDVREWLIKEKWISD